MLTDPRIRCVADLLIHHSVKLAAGEHVLIETFDCPDEIAVALIARLAQDHTHARQLAQGVSAIAGLRPHAQPNAIPSNMVFIHIDPALATAAQFAAALEQRGVRTLPLDPTRLRAVTHLDVTPAHIEHAIEQFGQVAANFAANSGLKK